MESSLQRSKCYDSSSMKPSSVGRVLEYFRVRAKKSFADVAQPLGLPEESIAAYESGSATLPFEQLGPYLAAVDADLLDLAFEMGYTGKLPETRQAFAMNPQTNAKVYDDAEAVVTYLDFVLQIAKDVLKGTRFLKEKPTTDEDEAELNTTVNRTLEHLERILPTPPDKPSPSVETPNLLFAREIFGGDSIEATLDRLRAIGLDNDTTAELLDAATDPDPERGLFDAMAPKPQGTNLTPKEKAELLRNLEKLHELGGLSKTALEARRRALEDPPIEH